MFEDAARKTCCLEVCRQCALSCCQDAKPPLTKERIQIIQEYLKTQGRSAERVLTHAEYWFPSVDSNGFCTFYDQGTKKCLIHLVKPETCTAGPVTFDINFSTHKVEWFLKRKELCPLAGKLFEAPEQLYEHLKEARRELLRLISALDSDSLRAILKRDEPQTFKIGEDSLPQEVMSKFILK
jgi:Fe-S-cluster containining protein